MPAGRKLPLTVSASIKTSRANATFKPGKGSIKINSFDLNVWGTELQRQLALIPIKLLPDKFKDVDVEINVRGGGPISQARAVMVALARGISRWTRLSGVKKILEAYEEHLLSGDPRRTEPKKFGGPGPRRRFQKSYR
ncbi:MAG: 30S ribosomal protein S9 [Thermoproteota archaeon]|jgi:small subunit ribosomal protein S9